MNSSRRKFIEKVSLASALLSALEATSENKIFSAAQPGFSLQVLATNWGFNGNWEAFADKAAQSGYDGVEVWAPLDSKSREEFLAAMSKYKMKFGLLIGGSDRDPGKHLEQFQIGLQTALSMKPLYINCHSGKDWFTFEDNKKIIELSYQGSQGSGIPVCHETHRGRILYSAPVAKSYIDQIPGLRLTADFSHWCVVHESLLEDQAETIALALSRTEHIHARIGHAEGPQVNDPQAPEWAKAVEAHVKWWDVVAERKRKEGKPLTILTEFGPPDYMPTEPYSRKPLADQWGINVFVKNLLRKRYS